MNRFLDEVKDPRLAFAVRQRKPVNLDQAVASTLELETYLLKMPTMVAGVNSATDFSIAATAAKPSFESSLQKIVERLEKIEGRLAAEDDSQSSYDRQSRDDKSHQRRGRNRSKGCYNCQQEGHFARDCPIPREDERNSLVEAVAKTVTSESETQKTDFLQEDQSQCVVKMDPTDQLNDKSVVSLGSGVVEMAVAPVVAKTLTSEVLLETSVTPDPTVTVEAVMEEQPVKAYSALKSSEDGQVRSSLVELSDSPNKEMKQDAIEKDSTKRVMNQAREETDGSKDETNRAKEELDNANRSREDEVCTNLSIVSRNKTTSGKARTVGPRLPRANENEHWIDQNCERCYYKVWDPGGSENSGRILHERE